MSFKVVEFQLSAAVANAGTFTVSYPSDSNDRVIRDAGFYRNSYGHKIRLETNEGYNYTEDFTLTFGTASITVTWANSRTLASGTRGWLQLNDRGDDQKRPFGGAHEVLKGAQRFAQLHNVEINLGAPDTADADGYFASQDLTSAGVASVSTTAAAAIAAAALAGVADVPRNVVAAWTGAAVLTVTGKDEYGNTLVESSASGTSFTGKKAFKEVTGISVSANVTSLTVGTGDVLGLPVFVPAIVNIDKELKNGVVLPAYQSNVLLMDRLVEADVDAGTALNLVSPIAGVIKKVWSVADTGITTGGSLTLEINTVAINGLSVDIATGAVEGEVDSDTPTQDHATTVVAAGDRIEVIPSAAFNASADIFVIIEIEPTVNTHGTFVAGDLTEPTATTGDVRGTYDPKTTCDGSAEFRIWARVTDPKYLGLDQYDG